MEQTGLAMLRKPFPENQISLLPKPLKKDSPKGKCNECGGYHGLPAVHLEYVGHAALTDRLLDCDPQWSWEPMAFDASGLPAFDKTGGLWIRLTILGVTRIGYGNAEPSSYKDVGAREKEVIGDALRNAGMRFGAALNLWHKGELHADPHTDEQSVQIPLKPVPIPPVKIDELKYYGSTANGPIKELVQPSFPISTEPPKSAWVQAVNDRANENNLPNHDPLGDYTPTFGKYKGMKIRDVIIHDLNNYVQYLQKSAADSNKPLSRNASEFISEVLKFIKTRTPIPKPIEQKPQPTDREIEQAFMVATEELPF